MLGRNIKRALERQGKSQRDFAKEVGISEVSLSRYINNVRVPRATVLRKIANALGVTTDQLLREEDGMIGLRPCPLCGNKIRHEKNWFSCSKCGYELIFTHRKYYSADFDSPRKSHAAMIDAWNMRAKEQLNP